MVTFFPIFVFSEKKTVLGAIILTPFLEIYSLALIEYLLIFFVSFDIFIYLGISLINSQYIS